MQPGFEHLSGDEYIALLEKHLAAAVAALRAKDATERACIARLEAKYAPRVQEAREGLRKAISKVNAVPAAVRSNARRYELLRRHQVQVWKLAIAATGDTLDALIDKEIERLYTQAEKPREIE